MATLRATSPLMDQKQWRFGVFSRDNFRCAAETHAPLCHGEPHHAHHIVYRSHLTRASKWVLGNGITLSLACHVLAHKTHNGNLPKARLIEAVDAVNAAMDEACDKPELRRAHFSAVAHCVTPSRLLRYQYSRIAAEGD